MPASVCKPPARCSEGGAGFPQASGESAAAVGVGTGGQQAAELGGPWREGHAVLRT